MPETDDMATAANRRSTRHVGGDHSSAPGTAASKLPAGHEEVMRLTRLLVAAAGEVDAAFVAVHRMHPTDVTALVKVMAANHRAQPMTAGTMAEQLGLTTGAVTALVDRLEKAGNVARVRDQHDRRKVILELTASGHNLADEYFAPVRRRSNEVMDQFTTAELTVISRFLAETATAMIAHRDALLSQHLADPEG